MSSSHDSTRATNALRPPTRSDSAPPSPILSTASNAGLFNAKYSALPSTSRHANHASVSSVASDSSGGFLGATDVAPSPPHDRAFEAIQRELGGADSAQSSSEDAARTERVYPNGARDAGRIYDEPEQLDMLRGASSGRALGDNVFRARASGSGHEGGSGPSSLDSSTGSLLAPVTALDASQRATKERRPGDRIFPAPLLLKSDRSYSSGGGSASSSGGFFAPVAPLSIPRRPSTSAGASPAPGAGPPVPQSAREWGRRDGKMGPPSSSSFGDAPRAAPSYQRHRQQQSSTSSLSHGSYLPYNNSYLYEPRQNPASSYAGSDAPPMSASGSGRYPTPPSTSLSGSTISNLSPPSAEPPISAQALLLDVLSLRSAASPMSLSQSQGPLSRSNTPLLAAGHQRIRSAGSSGSAEREGATRHSEDRGPARAAATYPGASKLDTVDLSHKRIAEVPVEVVDELRDEVEKLALGYNLLRDLPPSFAQLGSRLKYLNIRVNLLTTFPAVLCEMPSIEILDISRNKIRKLPQNPGTLVNLKVFSIAKNRVKRLPVWFTSMTHLKVLKLDHNPLEWPPREVTTFPATASLSGQPMSKQEEADEMQRWLPALMRWLREHRDREVEREQQREREKRRRPSLAVASEDERISSEDRLARWPAAMTRTESGRLQSSPRIPSSESIPRTRTVHHLAATSASPAPGDALDTAEASVRHSRNASHSTTQTLAPVPRPGIRSKKSLPDLRQSHADILAERRTGTTLEEEPRQPDLPALDGLLRRFREERPARLMQSLSARAAVAPSFARSESARTATTPAAAGAQSVIEASGEGKRLDDAGDLERSSGAYFRRLSMLPVSTIAKTIPLALLHFAEVIRGILFALSQVHSALRQFVIFAAQDRLPAPIARLMRSADTSMSTLINALDRFDSLSRRGTPPTAIVRAVLVACRDSVATFAALVAALQPQLATLTASADVRYTRTLLLMLFGSVGEIASSWTAVAPLLAGSDDPSLATLILQPPTPSPTAAAGTYSDGPAPRLTRQRSTTRRHAGSFSVEDVELGANLPPADIPPVPALPCGPLVQDDNANGPSTPQYHEVNGGATLRTRPPPWAKSAAASRAAPPPALAIPPQMGYEQMVQKAFEHPITPGGLFHPGGAAGTIDPRAPSRTGSFSVQSGGLGIPPMPALPTSSSSSAVSSGVGVGIGVGGNAGGAGAPPASYHPHRMSRPVSTLNADETFVDTADSTVSIASDVYGMLLDSFEDPAHLGQFAAIGKRRLKELAELCKAGYDSTQRLQRAIERVRGDDARGRLKFATGEAIRLGDASYDFVSNVIRTAKLIKSVSLDFAFSQQMREGIGQLTLGTREFARLLTTSHTSFRPARMMTGEASANAGASHGAPTAAAVESEAGSTAEVRPQDFA
ncbi:hypothetical protein JCM3770_000075 [Rhodotorula araucariae]